MGEFESHSPIELQFIFVNNRQISRTQRTVRKSNNYQQVNGTCGLKCQSRSVKHRFYIKEFVCNLSDK